MFGHVKSGAYAGRYIFCENSNNIPFIGERRNELVWTNKYFTIDTFITRSTIESVTILNDTTTTSSGGYSGINLGIGTTGSTYSVSSSNHLVEIKWKDGKMSIAEMDNFLYNAILIELRMAHTSSDMEAVRQLNKKGIEDGRAKSESPEVMLLCIIIFIVVMFIFLSF